MAIYRYFAAFLDSSLPGISATLSIGKRARHFASPRRFFCGQAI